MQLMPSSDVFLYTENFSLSLSSIILFFIYKDLSRFVNSSDTLSNNVPKPQNLIKHSPTQSHHFTHSLYPLQPSVYKCFSSPQVPQHKRMLWNTLQRQPLPWILLQQFRNQILGILRQSMRPSNIHPLNSPIGGTMTLRFKWWRPHEEFIQQYSQCPRINLLIVFTTLHHLWR
jgi:hypothetical protein